MTPEYLQTLRSSLNGEGITIAAGLTEEQIREIESDFGFLFPPDLRALLAAFLPVAAEFPDWRTHRSQDLIEWLDYPADEIATAVEDDGFWLPEWGPHPVDRDDAGEEARRLIAGAPILIPVFANCFLPAIPAERGNPVLAFEGSVVSVYGSDLGWFFADQLEAPDPPWPRPAVRPIDFWSRLVG